MALMPGINFKRLAELTGVSPSKILADSVYLDTGHLHAEVIVPCTRDQWEALWTPEEPKCSCEQEEPDGITFLTYQEPPPLPLSQDEDRLILTLRALGATESQRQALIYPITAGMHALQIREASNAFLANQGARVKDQA